MGRPRYGMLKKGGPMKNDPAVTREVFCRYITLKNGKRIYPKNAKVFHFFVKKQK
jgi:hypothetical protein